MERERDLGDLLPIMLTTLKNTATITSLTKQLGQSYKTERTEGKTSQNITLTYAVSLGHGPSCSSNFGA